MGPESLGKCRSWNWIEKMCDKFRSWKQCNIFEINKQWWKTSLAWKHLNIVVHSWKWAFWNCTCWSDVHEVHCYCMQFRRTVRISCPLKDWVLASFESARMGWCNESAWIRLCCFLACFQSTAVVSIVD